jgi:DNA-binding winged helix-turn-helix (wHTH) protein/tetratricopeptide (TPR) repeat protein
MKKAPMLSHSSSSEEVAVAERYRVCDLLVEVDTRRVLRGGEEVHLTELSFDVLVVLLRRAPGVVSKRQLMNEVWQGLVVEPDTVKKRITLLRESLADGERQDPLIRVVRGRGYAISTLVERLDANSPHQGKNWRHSLTVLGVLALFALGLTLAVVMLSRDDASEQSTDFTAKPAATTVGTGAPVAETDPFIDHADIDPLAYQAYLEGRMLRRTVNGLAKAITALERAIDIEPGFAAAYAELGLCKLTSSGRGMIDHRQSELDAARKLTKRALELDSQLPLAYAAASAVASVDWNWLGAETLLQKGLSISPDDEYLLAYQSRMASIRGDLEIAITLGLPLVEHRVTDGGLHHTMGGHYYRAGRYREAIDSYRHALRLSPGRPDTHMAIGRIRAIQGDPDAALREMALEPHPDCQLYGFVIAHTTAGNESVANGMLEKLISVGAKRWAYRIGALHAYRGDIDKAFGSLDLAYALRDSGLIKIKTDPLLDSIRDDPRYVELLVRMKLD